jgi:hypothetical protein
MARQRRPEQGHGVRPPPGVARVECPVDDQFGVVGTGGVDHRVGLAKGGTKEKGASLRPPPILFDVRVA